MLEFTVSTFARILLQVFHVIHCERDLGIVQNKLPQTCQTIHDGRHQQGYKLEMCNKLKDDKFQTSTSNRISRTGF